MAVEITKERLDEFLIETAGGKSMREICHQEGMPTRRQIQDLLRTDEGFASQYARACDMRADEVFDEMFEIADTPVIGIKTKTDKDGNVETTEGDMIEHRRLQIDARKWALARMSPKKYGDKLALHGDKTLDPIQNQEVPPDEILKARLAAIRSRTNGEPDADAD